MAQFDIVFSSYGVLPWLPNLRRWAEVVAHFLRPGGTFYVVEFHPVVGALAERARPQLQRHYFAGPGPICWEGGTETDYADPSHVLKNSQYEWIHTLGDVVTSIMGAGLVLEWLHEHPVMPEAMRSFMVQDDDGWWRIPDDPLPLTYSIRASKPR
jgi:SAM-dependent methyltransferase